MACSGDENFEFSFVVVQPPSSSTPYCKNTVGSKESIGSAKYSLRLTFMQRGLKPISASRLRQEYTLICDRLVAAGEATDLKLSLSVGSKFAVRVEAFNPKDKTLAYAGQSEELDISAERAVVFLRPVKQVTCADAARYPRAFHSATLLPDGKVLLLGGLVSDATLGEKLHAAKGEEYAFATGTAEIYDPETMTFQQVDGTIPARAFHRAHLLPSAVQDSYEILVVGGVKSTATAGGKAFRLRAFQLEDQPYLISPFESAAAAEALLVTYKPTKVAGQKPKLTHKTLSALPKLMMPRSVDIPATGQAVFAGGGATYTVNGQLKSFTAGTAFWVDLKDKASRSGADPRVVATTPLARTRVGHGMVPLGPSRYFIVGGTVNPASCAHGSDTKCDADTAEWLNFSSGKPVPSVITFTPNAERTVWHTLTTIGMTDAEIAPGGSQVPKTPDKALMVGGFPMSYDWGGSPPAGTKLQLACDQCKLKNTLQLVKDGNPPSFHVVSTSGAGHFLAAEYHAAVRLADGSVMLSGGNVNATYAQFEACKGKTSVFCAYRQIAVYGLEGGSVKLKQSGKMTLGRYGHQATRLLDNTVLLSGGISLVGSKPELLRHAEVYNPRTGAASEDPFGRLPAAEKGTKTCLSQD